MSQCNWNLFISEFRWREREEKKRKISLHEKLRNETLMSVRLTIAWCVNKEWSLPIKECTLNSPTQSLIGNATIELLWPALCSLSFSCSSPFGSCVNHNAGYRSICDHTKTTFSFWLHCVCLHWNRENDQLK